MSSVPQAMGELMQSEELVSRSDTLRSIETELTKAREMAECPADEVLRYLIDMAILEVQAKIPSRVERGNETGSLPSRMRLLVANKTS